MAGNITLNTGTGGAKLATDQATVNTVVADVQYIKLMDGTAGSAAVIPGDATNGMFVNVKATAAPATLPLPAGASTSAKQPALGVAGTASADVITVQGIASMTALKVDGSAVTQPVSAVSLPLPTGAATSAKQPALGTAGTASADVITVQGAALMTALKVDGSAVTQPVSGTVTANAGTGTFNIQANASVNNAQVVGTAIAVGNGIASAGCQRVTIASDNTAFATNAAQSGAWTVQPGNTANTTPWLVSQVPATSGGLTTFHLVAAATTNATNIKASAGQVFGWYIYNSNAAARKVVFHNASAAPTAGAAVFFSIVVPPTSGANVFSESGIAFSTGIGITTVTGLADADATAVALNDLVINIFYK